MEGSLLRVNSKHKLTYKGHYEDQCVDTMRVRKAVQYLKETNVYYKDKEFVENTNMRLLKRRLIVMQKVRKRLQKVGKQLQMLLKMHFCMISSSIVSFRTRSLQQECLISTGIDFEGGS